MSEEKELIKILRTGNIDLINSLFEQIYLKYKGLVCFVIAKYVNVKEDVVDLAQDVFLSFFNNAEKVTSNLKFYLTTSAKNKALNFIKKEKRVSIIETEKIDLLDEKFDTDNYLFKDTLKVLKENLKEIEYTILILHLLDQNTFKDIAEKLSIKESSVKSIYFRSLKKAKTLLERGQSYE